MSVDKVVFILVMMFIATLAKATEDTYLSCLKESFKGSHSFSAEEVRSLCMEISGTHDASYSWIEKRIVPNNEFTKCYDREVKSLDSLGEKRAGEVAKIICRYEAR